MGKEQPKTALPDGGWALQARLPMARSGLVTTYKPQSCPDTPWVTDQPQPLVTAHCLAPSLLTGSSKPTVAGRFPSDSWRSAG